MTIKGKFEEMKEHHEGRKEYRHELREERKLEHELKHDAKEEIKQSNGTIYAILNFDYVKPFNEVMEELK